MREEASVAEGAFRCRVCDRRAAVVVGYCRVCWDRPEHWCVESALWSRLLLGGTLETAAHDVVDLYDPTTVAMACVACERAAGEARAARDRRQAIRANAALERIATAMLELTAVYGHCVGCGAAKFGPHAGDACPVAVVEAAIVFGTTIEPAEPEDD
jgi:hypothetical protein